MAGCQFNYGEEMFKSIRTKMLASYMGLIVLSIGAVGYFNHSFVINHLEETQRHKLEAITHSSANITRSKIDNLTTLFAILAESNEFQQYLATRKGELLDGMIKKLKNVFPRISFINPEGYEELQVIRGKVADSSGKVISESLFEEALRNPGKAIISTSQDSDLNGPVLNISIAKTDGLGGRYMGTLMVAVPLPHISENLASLVVGESGFILIIDKEGRIVSHPDRNMLYSEISGSDTEAARIIADAMDMGAGSGRAEILNEDGFITYEPIEELGWSAIAVMPYSEFMVPSSILKNTTAWVSIAAFIVAWIIAVIMSGGIAKPLLKLAESAKKAAAGDFSTRIDNKSEDEVGIVISSFNKMSENLQRMTGELHDFAYTASHDLQEPLRKVATFGDRLKMKYADKLDDQGCDYIDRMNSATKRMQKFIDDLLIFSRVATKNRPLEPVDLSEVTKEVLSDLEVAISNTDARIEVGELHSIQADRLQMQQLLQNLIGNAIKFHKKGEPPVVKISGSFTRSNNSVKNNPHSSRKYYEMTVEDSGIGFDEKHSERIFGTFQKLHGRSEYEGSGIGLSVCRKITERLDGDIIAKSSPGMGAKFIVTIPAEQIQGGSES